MRILLVVISICSTQIASAFSWQDLWATKDQQAKAMMDKGQFAKAKDTFEREDWRATSAYRAGDYQQAETLYQSFKNEDAYYNQGNTLAYMGKYEQAIEAYDKTLTINPNNQDALHNRKIVEDLLKKDKKDQDKQEQDKKEQDKQEQDKQEQDKKEQDNKEQDNKEQDKKEQDKKEQDNKEQDKKEQDNKEQDKKEQDNKEQGKKEQDKQEQDKPHQDKSAASAPPSEAQREQQQAKDQWLRLIPDDPGGLLREKFLRDHLRRQRGWDQ